MLALLVVLFIAELWVMVQVASAIGVLQTIVLLVAITIVGIWLVKRQGSRCSRGCRPRSPGAGTAPGVVDGFLILAAGSCSSRPASSPMRSAWPCCCRRCAWASGR